MGARDWRVALQRTVKQFNRDHLPIVAAGATFFSLLALFPALGVFISLYGLFADVAEARAEIIGFQGFLPEGAVIVLTQQIDRLTALPHRSLGLSFVASLLPAIWSANAGMKL
jgi:membrane protein